MAQKKIKKNLMILGTASSVGKSLVSTALCRILHQDGYEVAPFKAQNMALNSWVTRNGLEMGRAQVVQAEAAGIEPVIEMNPVLLKPCAGLGVQVILNGKIHETMTGESLAAFRPELLDVILKSYNFLADKYEVTILEGAGSPVELNLKDSDIVNMNMAALVDAPVILVGDIDRGGVFASLAGTLQLLQDDEQARVKGLIINKFRGDVNLFKDGIALIEKITGKPVLGVIPYFDHKIDDEDAVSDVFNLDSNPGSLDIGILKLPHLANFTDFTSLEYHDDVSLRYIRQAADFGSPDLLIIPGSKNTIYDLEKLKTSGLFDKVLKFYRGNGLIFGVCGGFQMLGKHILDPDGVEGETPRVHGFGFLDTQTILLPEKQTRQIRGKLLPAVNSYFQNMVDNVVDGYEIHVGETRYGVNDIPFIQTEERVIGVMDGSGSVFGTYLHGFFDNTSATHALLNYIRRRKGLDIIDKMPVSRQMRKETEYDRIAEIFRTNLDLGTIYNILDM